MRLQRWVFDRQMIVVITGRFGQMKNVSWAEYSDQ